MPHARAASSGWRTLLIGIAVCYSLVHLGYSMWRYSIFSNDPLYRARDLARVFEQAVALRQTGALPAPDVVLYPPFYYLLLWPLTSIDFRTLTYGFYVAQFVYVPAAVVLLVKAASPSQTPSAMAYLIAAVLTVNFQPFLETLALYKVEGIEFFLICLALSTFRKKRDGLTGALVAFAANLKYLPGILAVYFVLKRQWKVVGGMLLGAVLVCAAIGASPLGIGGIWSYGIRYPLTFLFGHSLQGVRPEANLEFQSLSGTVNRWFVGTDRMLYTFVTDQYAPVTHPQLALTMAAIMKAVIGGLYVSWILRSWKASKQDGSWERSLLEVSMTLLLIVVFASAARIHYAILLLPAYVITALTLYHHPRLFQWKDKLLFALAYSLPAMIIPGGLLNRLPPNPLFGKYYAKFYLWMSLPFYGYGLLAVCILWCHRRLQQSR